MHRLALIAVLALAAGVNLHGAEPTPEKVKAYRERCEQATAAEIKRLEGIIATESQQLSKARRSKTPKQSIAIIKREMGTAKESLAALKDGSKHCDPSLKVPVSQNEIGKLNGFVEVVKIVGENEMVVSLRYDGPMVIDSPNSGRSNTVESRALTRAPGNNFRSETTRHQTVLVRGLPTQGRHGSDKTLLEGAFEVKDGADMPVLELFKMNGISNNQAD